MLGLPGPCTHPCTAESLGTRTRPKNGTEGGGATPEAAAETDTARPGAGHLGSPRPQAGSSTAPPLCAYRSTRSDQSTGKPVAIDSCACVLETASLRAGRHGTVQSPQSSVERSACPLGVLECSVDNKSPCSAPRLALPRRQSSPRPSLGHISATSRPYLGYISATSRPNAHHHRERAVLERHVRLGACISRASIFSCASTIVPHSRSAGGRARSSYSAMNFEERRQRRKLTSLSSSCFVPCDGANASSFPRVPTSETSSWCFDASANMHSSSIARAPDWKSTITYALSSTSLSTLLWLTSCPPLAKMRRGSERRMRRMRSKKWTHFSTRVPPVRSLVRFQLPTFNATRRRQRTDPLRALVRLQPSLGRV
mmetsp:Transcript_12532/g.37786  ORF Transcript_12532/g.37786 Transcript_12532/m.37786 type:complete len:370 (-) Transcript_12532:34-1143(-)